MSTRRSRAELVPNANDPRVLIRMIGLIAAGLRDPRTLAEVLDTYIDEGTVELLTISAGAGQGADTWLRFYCGDTEVGYIFHGDVLKAIVGDQDINPV